MGYSDPDRQRAWKRADYAKNRERYCAEKRERYKRNPLPFLEATKRSRAKHIERRRDDDRRQGAKYYAANRDRVLLRTARNARERYASDWAYAEARRVRCRLRQAFWRAGASKPLATLRLVGCTWQELRNHIESHFVPNMGWHNRHEWHLDHIYPLCAADLKNPLEAAAVCNWRNLRPAWRIDNLRKSGSVTEEAKELFASILSLVSLGQEMAA